MNQSLPTVSTLLGETWNQFKATWNDSTKVSIWILYVGLVNFALAIVEKIAPQARIYFFPIDIASAILGLWVSIRIVQAMLEIDAGKKPDLSSENQSKAWRYVLPMIWIGLLTGLIVLAGTIFFIIPGIYLMVALSFAEYILLTQDKRGVAALTASRELIKGRWWSAAWRLFAGSFVIGLGTGAVMMLVTFAVGLLAGPTQFVNALQDPANTDALVNGVIQLIQSMVATALVPLSVLYGVKLFRALEKTKPTV